jgi:hypothetical protein
MKIAIIARKLFAMFELVQEMTTQIKYDRDLPDTKRGADVSSKMNNNEK